MIIWAWVAAYSSQFKRLSLELSTTHPQLLFHPWLVDSVDTSLCLTQVILSLLPQLLWWLQWDSSLPVSCIGMLGPGWCHPLGRQWEQWLCWRKRITEGALCKFKHQCLPSSLSAPCLWVAHTICIRLQPLHLLLAVKLPHCD